MALPLDPQPGKPPPRLRVVSDAGAVARASERREALEQARVFFDSLERGMPTTWVTWAMLTVNVAVFLGLFLVGVHATDPSSQDLLRFGADWAPRTRSGQWWRLLTATFLHAGLFHLLVNMYCLKVLGPLAERLLGHAGFLVTYLAAGVAGSLASNAFGDGAVSVGASGSIFGLFGVLLAFTFAAPRDEVPEEARRRLRSVTVQNLVLNLAIGFSIARINNWAHLGGLLGGFLCGLPLARPPRPSAGPGRAGRVAIVAAGTLLATAACAWALRTDDIEGTLARAGASEAQALRAYEGGVRDVLAHRLPPRGLADLVDREVVARYRAVEAEARALARVPRGSRAQRDAIRVVARAAVDQWDGFAQYLRSFTQAEQALVARWKAAVLEAARSGAALPPPLPSSTEALRPNLPPFHRRFGGSDGDG